MPKPSASATHTTIARTFRAFVRSSIAQRGQTLRSFAHDDLDMDEGNLCNILREDANPRVGTLIRIARELGYEPDLVFRPIEKK